MGEKSRESRINEAFVRVAGTLTQRYDVVELLESLVEECVDLLDVAAGGLLLVDAVGYLELIASSSEAAEFVEVMQLASGSGPCLDCYRTGTAVSVNDIDADAARWPEFRAAALQGGFRSIHCVPMRVQGQILGTLNLLSTAPGARSLRDEQLAQALADVATIGLLHEHNLRDVSVITEQLQLALDTRILIEQAKGVLAETLKLPIEEAFRILRDYARAHGRGLRETAGGIIDRTIRIQPAPQDLHTPR